MVLDDDDASIACIAIKSDIHVQSRMNCNNFSDPSKCGLSKHMIFQTKRGSHYLFLYYFTKQLLHNTVKTFINLVKLYKITVEHYVSEL